MKGIVGPVEGVQVRFLYVALQNTQTGLKFATQIAILTVDY